MGTAMPAASFWSMSSLSGSGTNVSKLGTAVFTTFLLPFEVTSALLVIAVVGAVVLARRPRRGLPPEIELPESEPDAAAPAATGPDATGPDATARDATARDATARDATAPKATEPEAPTLGDAPAPLPVGAAGSSNPGHGAAAVPQEGGSR